MRSMKYFLVVSVLLFGTELFALSSLPHSQAVYIYNFTRYIQWPNYSMGDKFVIAVFGKSEVYDELVKYTADRKIGNKSIAIVRIQKIEDIEKFQIVFISEEQNSKLSAIRKHIGQKPCLLISEIEGSNTMGSIVEFFMKENKLRFRINGVSAKQQKLIISNELLKMSV
jgi:hypothetical protein